MTRPLAARLIPLLTITFLLTAACGLTACSDDDPLEEAAEQIEDGADEARDAVDDAADEVGDAIDDLVDG